MSINGVKISIEPLQSLAFGAFNVDLRFIAFPLPLAHPIVMTTFTNTTDQDMAISIVGTTRFEAFRQIIIPAGMATVRDWSSDRSDMGGVAALPTNSIIWVQPLVMPMSGYIALESVYLGN